MRSLFDLVLKRWLFAALLASAAMLAAAHAFESFGHLAPCSLCLKERQVYWATLAISAIGIGLEFTPIRLRSVVCGILALVFVSGAGLAAYHAGAEWKFWPGPASCSGGSTSVSVADMARLLNGAGRAIPSCDKAAWVFLGISMAGWNALISLGLAIMSGLAARERSS